MLQEGKVVLRPLAESDQAALAHLANNKNVWDNLRDYVPFPYSEMDALAFITHTKQEKTQMTFAITYEGQFCGVIGLVGQPDVYRKTAEIGYWLGEPFWGKGIMTTAVRLMTHYGLHQLDFLRLYAGVFAYNAGSMRVLTKNGYTQDGLFRKAIFKNGQVWDEHRFSRTK